MTTYQDIPEWSHLLFQIEGLLDHKFADSNLVFESLVHSSFSREHEDVRGRCVDNERLEFLGDAVIGLVTATLLMRRFTDAAEGRLSKLRSALVSRKMLAEIARTKGLGDLLLLGRGEKWSGGADKSSILAGALEAVVGALYQDAGLSKAEAFVSRMFEPWIDSVATEVSCKILCDYKTDLQEKTQAVYKQVPVYRLVEAYGPEHQKTFQVEILIDRQVIASGSGRSKKQAEQNAAAAALESL